MRLDQLDQPLYWVTWNLFLASVPVALAYLTSWLAGVARKKPVFRIPVAVLLLAWLAFLPNTCYLLTEWRHFLMTLDAANLYLRSQIDRDVTLKLMLYTAFYFCYSAAGMLALTLAIRPIARLARKDRATLWVYAIPLFLMLSVGVYLGLVLRYNSWDLVVRPHEVMNSVLGIVYRPKLFSFIIAFAGFLALAYAAIDMWIDGFLARVNRGKGL
ncbi:MAG: DUF1361 domain-containing protein [Armatimonadetes bacterium]|nr:DUF1361 domain-containing protein [Armatimonadota bacterium]